MAKQKKSVKKEAKKDRSGLLIPAGLFVGIGAGLITGQLPGYTMIGLGVGFLLAFLMSRK